MIVDGATISLFRTPAFRGPGGRTRDRQVIEALG